MRSHAAARHVYRHCRLRAISGCHTAGAAAAVTAAVRTTASTGAGKRPSSTLATAPRGVVHRHTFQPMDQQQQQQQQQRRTFLGSLRRRPPRELKEQQVEPGYDVLLQFRASTTQDTRRPPTGDLVQAFREFFEYKYEYGKRVNATQAHWALQLFEYLCEEEAAVTAETAEGSSSQERPASRRIRAIHELTSEDLRIAREALAKTPQIGHAAAAAPGAALMQTKEQASVLEPASAPPVETQDHLQLCRAIYAEMKRRNSVTALDCKRHISVLCQYGAALEAAELRAAYAQTQASATAASSRRDKELWLTVLEGLARENREEELLREAAAAEAAGLEYMPLFREIMTTFYARRNQLAKTREWFERPMQGTARQLPATARTYAELLAFSQRSGSSLSQMTMPKTRGKGGGGGGGAERQWVQTVFQQLCDSNPPKEQWDVIFQWAVVTLGKGVEEIRHMMETMQRHNAQRPLPGPGPDVATINGLVAAAASQGDVLLAERFVQLGVDMDIAADAHTYLLQLDYRVAANDLSGAYASFGHLQNMDCPDDEDVPVMNRYVRALCAVAEGAILGGNGAGLGAKAAAGAGTGAGPVVSGDPAGPALARIRSVLDAVEQRQVSLEPATVVALCMVFLRHDRQFEAIDVLSVHAMQFSVAERAVVREALVDYIVDRRASSTARAWDAYSLLRQYFAETPPASRARLMDGFFRRRRSDMACYVFGHMRGAADPALRPTADLYVRCLEGLGRHPDADGLQMVHNMLKMDAMVSQPDTRLYNALMLAYAASGDRDRALDFWHDISHSAEGPSYSSLAIFFWACEGQPFGDGPARSVWAKLQRMEIDVPAQVFDNYCGAMAGQGHREEAQSLIAGMEKSVGYGPTATTLAIAHNALPGQDLQRDFTAWATAEYPELWQQVRKRGCRTTVDGLRRYNVTREMKA